MGYDSQALIMISDEWELWICEMDCFRSRDLREYLNQVADDKEELVWCDLLESMSQL